MDTTLGYARLYDGTVAADYYSAMSGIEQRLALPEDRLAQPTGVGHLLALVDALRQTSLNEQQVAAPAYIAGRAAGARRMTEFCR